MNKYFKVKANVYLRKRKNHVINDTLQKLTYVWLRLDLEKFTKTNSENKQIST